MLSLNFARLGAVVWLGTLTAMIARWIAEGRPADATSPSSTSVPWISDLNFTATSKAIWVVVTSLTSTLFQTSLILSLLEEGGKGKGHAAAESGFWRPLLCMQAAGILLILASVFDMHHDRQIHDILLLLSSTGYMATIGFEWRRRHLLDVSLVQVMLFLFIYAAYATVICSRIVSMYDLAAVWVWILGLGFGFLPWTCWLRSRTVHTKVE
ncbi:hypothetical protein LX32DRAFT_647484 [Colletotrichum zoysiae]|uniref:Uncharacterized protein n=1 Tax=Colletotrichum zoysiae TaxID=1216348 RepID=A0AAD9H237_9PEZI|nr:hypothetical protein LX32DRAFT_647484 [Colletotrichum zoysiae]